MNSPVRAPVAAGAVIAAVVATAGCSSLSGPAAQAAPSSPAAAARSAEPSRPAGAPVPVLGRPAGVFAQGTGFGQARPARIFNGGDPTGLVTKVAWKSWGAPRAVASGISEYVGAGQSVATGTPQPVTVVAFKLGTCHGTRMYKAVEWYFPQHGQAFNPGRYENICAGRYVPGP
ncbi:MAG TPA: hypothetical protein VGY50_11850 [Streptosporangiaceae bacterium]|nr:hypothetical protein [Streptosporangiaceae bacterium]